MQTSRDMTRTQTLLHLTSAPGRQLLGGVRSRDAAAPRLPHAHRPSGTRVNGPLGSGHARHARHPSTRGFDSRSKRPRRKFVKFQKENESGTSRGGLAWSSSTVHAAGFAPKHSLPLPLRLDSVLPPSLLAGGCRRSSETSPGRPRGASGGAQSAVSAGRGRSPPRPLWDPPLTSECDFRPALFGVYGKLMLFSSSPCRHGGSQ